MDETSQPLELLLTVTRDGSRTLGAQIEDGLRQAIRGGALKAGAEVPSGNRTVTLSADRTAPASVASTVTVTTFAVPVTVLTTTEAEAVVGRPLTPMSAAGVARRTARRNYKRKKKR
mgnify:CR=1 FL=1